MVAKTRIFNRAKSNSKPNCIQKCFWTRADLPKLTTTPLSLSITKSYHLTNLVAVQKSEIVERLAMPQTLTRK